MYRFNRSTAKVVTILGVVFIFGAVLLGDDRGSAPIVEGPAIKNKNQSGSPEKDAKQVRVTRIVDGDTLEIADGERVRLIGIDAPEKGDCYSDEATAALTSLVLDKTLRAAKDESERDKYGRLLFYLYDGDTFVNFKLVQEGAARAYAYAPDTTHASDFASAEQSAKGAKRGVWGACSFFDVLSSPASNNPVQQSAPTECTIKGNISSSGKIYHLPGCGSYDKTVINTSAGERWFCNEEEAQAAGWRKAKNCP